MEQRFIYFALVYLKVCILDVKSKDPSDVMNHLNYLRVYAPLYLIFNFSRLLVFYGS